MPETELARDVDVLGAGHTGLHQLRRLHGQCDDQSGGDETGDVTVDHYARLADSLGELPSPQQRQVAGLVAADQLTQRHHWHRREEVGPYHALRALRHRRDLGDRDGTGVRRQHRVVSAHVVQRSEDVALDLDRLEHRLHDDVGVGSGVDVRGRGDPSHGGVGVLDGEPALLHEPVHGGPDGAAGALQRLVADVAQDHVVPGLSGHLGNARAHETSADDRQLLCHIRSVPVRAPMRPSVVRA